jgi:uncharacterized protein YybS (DUF2232 family)
MARAAFASAVMFIVGALVPVVGAVAVVLAPMPILGCVIGFRNPRWRVAAVVLAATGLVMVGGGLEAGAGFFATIGVGSAAMSVMLERRRPFEHIVVVSAGLMVLVGALLALAAVGSPQELAQALHRDLLDMMTRSEKFYGVAGLDASLSPDVRGRVIDTLVRLMPALMVVSAALIALANLAVFWRISGRQQRVGYALFGELALWSTPEWLIWVLLVTGFGLFIPLPPLSTAALNCFVCVVAVYFCHGLAIMAFYFRRLAMPSFARGLVYFITVVQPVLALLVCTAGVFDLWIDFRRLKPSSPHTDKASNPL